MFKTETRNLLAKATTEPKECPRCGQLMFGIIEPVWHLFCSKRCLDNEIKDTFNDPRPRKK